MAYNNKELQANGVAFDHWIEPLNPYKFFYDFSNFSILIFFIFIFYKYKKFEIFPLFLISFFMMITPFIINNFIINWQFFPDQSKYFDNTRNIRSSIFDIRELKSFLVTEKSKVFLSSFIYAIMPVSNIETYNSIGFINRFFITILFVFLIKNNHLTLSTKLVFLISPSLILYSSVSLRESLILVLMIFSLYNLLYKNHTLSFISIVLLFFLKIQNLIIVLITYLAFYLLKEFKKKKLMVLSSLFFLILIILNFQNSILYYLNYYRVGFFTEEYGSFQGFFVRDFYENITLGNLIPFIFENIIKIFLSPFPNLDSTFKLVIFYENLVIYSILFYKICKNFYSKNKLISYVWILSIIFSLLIYTSISINDGVIHRFKLILFIYFLIGFDILDYYLKKKFKLNKNIKTL